MHPPFHAFKIYSPATGTLVGRLTTVVPLLLGESCGASAYWKANEIPTEIRSRNIERFRPEVDDGDVEDGLSLPRHELQTAPTEAQHAHAHIETKHDRNKDVCTTIECEVSFTM